MKLKFISIVLLSIVVSHTVYSQHGVKFRGSDGWGLGGRYEQYFDKYNLKTFSAKITSIDTLAPFREMSYGIQLTVKKDNREQVVHLGPGWFILYQDMNLNVNNEVEVRGCEATIEGKTVIMAVYVKQVSKGRTLYLRDDNGIPYWCAWRRE